MAEAIDSADLLVGNDGLYGSRNPASLPPGALVVADNLTYVDGTLKKEGGAAKFNATAITGSASILAGFDWWPTTLLQRSIIFTTNGTVLRDTGAGTYPVTLASGLSATAPNGLFVAGGKEAAALDRKLFLFSGENAVQVLSGDGVTMTAHAGPPTDWTGTNQPVGGVIHQSRLFGYGNLNDPHRLYFSAVTNHELFTGLGTGTLPIYSGVGERILQCISLRGFLIVFKYPYGIFAVDTRGLTPAEWRVDKISDEVGICSIAAAVLAERSIFFLDATGNIQILEQVTQDSFEVQNIGTLAFIRSFINSNVELTELGRTKSIFYGVAREIHFGVPHRGTSVNNRRLVVDFNSERPKFRYSTRDAPVSLWSKKVANVPRMSMGDNAGFVWDLDQAARNKDGAGYQIDLKSAPTDLGYIDPGLSRKNKNCKFLEVIFEPSGNFILNVDLILDGRKEDTYAFNLAGPSGGFIIGAGIIGTDVLGIGTFLFKIRRRVTGSGKHIQIRAYNAGANELISIAKFILYYSPSDERTSLVG